MTGKLEGRVAIVTGGARGQGEAEARLFTAEGALVVIGDVLDELGEEVAESLGESALYVSLDVTDLAAWESAAVATLERFGTIDILVNNAGVGPVADLDKLSLEEYLCCFMINEAGPFLGMQTVFPVMKEKGGGSIVNTSSAAGALGAPGAAAYCATKAGCSMLTKIAAAEWGKYGIRVNAILPGPIDTAMLRGNSPKNAEEMSKLVAGRFPLRRVADPIEVARAALFLASDDSSFVTGLDMLVDGGRNAALPRYEG